MNKTVWKRVWARKYAPFLASAFILSYLKNKQFGAAPNKMFVPEGGLMAYYFENTEFIKIVRKYNAFLQKQNLPRYAKKYEQEFKDFLAFAQKIATADPAGMDRTQLAQLVKKIHDRIIQSSDYQFYAFLVLEGVAIDVEKKISGFPGGDSILEAITTPYKITRLAKSHVELLHIAKSKNVKALKTYAQTYAWIPVYELMDNPWSEKDFARQIQSLKAPGAEIARYHKNRHKNLKTYQTYVKKLTDARFKKQVEMVHYFSYLKEMRDDYRRHAYYLLRPFFTQLAKVLHITFTELNYLTLPEVAASVAQGRVVVQKRELRARQKAFALVLTNGQLRVISAQKAEDLGRKLLPKSSAEIRGSCANPGKVMGKVSIIYHQGEFKKFKSGNILVTTMTHPEFLPVMKTAKAIITDEGGITTHAAIVSRELGVPCVIGTKIATKVLRDGDLVEVDATRGIVKKLHA